MPSTTHPAPTATPPDAPPRAMIGVLEFGESELRLWDLPFTIGRASKNTLTIRDPHLSRTHCAIDATPRGYRVQSLSSRNTVRVNGRPIESFLLQDGDTIEISKYSFTFRVVDEEGNPVQSEAAEVPMARSVAPKAEVPPAASAPDAPMPAPVAPPTSAAPPVVPPVAGVPPAHAASPVATRRHTFRQLASRATSASHLDLAGFAVGGVLVLAVLGIGAMLILAENRAAGDEIAQTLALADEFGSLRQVVAQYHLDQHDEATRERALLDAHRAKLNALPRPAPMSAGGPVDETDPGAVPHAVREPSIHQRAPDEDPPPAKPDPPPAQPDPPPSQPDPPPTKPDPPPAQPDPPPAQPDPPPAAPVAGPAAVGPAPRAGKPTLPFFGLRIDGARVAFVVDKSATMRPIVEQLRAELTKAIEGLAPTQAFTLVLYDDEARFFSRDLLAANDRFKTLAKRFVDGLAAERESRPDEALAAMLAIERLEAIAVVTNGRLSPAGIDVLTKSLERGASGPRVYLVDGAALVRAKAGTAGGRDPELDALMAKVARQP